MIIRTTALKLAYQEVTDRYGDMQRTNWSDSPVASPYPARRWTGCLHYPSDSRETLQAGRSGVLDGHTLHLPYNTPIDAADRFHMGWSGDQVWLVDGTPEWWPIQIAGWDHGTVVHLKRLVEPAREAG